MEINHLPQAEGRNSLLKKKEGHNNRLTGRANSEEQLTTENMQQDVVTMNDLTNIDPYGANG